MKLGLALGSGGARGWVHLGVIRRLEEIGVAPDVIAGCSMGALVGAAWAGGRLEALEGWARGLSMQKFASYIDLRPSSGGLVRGMGIGALLAEIGVPADFAALERPFLAVATDMQTGREIWLKDGNVHEAVRGSVGIPGVFQPYKRGDHWLLDGGLTNPVPVTAARALGAEVTISVNPNAKSGRSYWESKPKQGALAEMLANPALRRHLPETWLSAVSAGESRETPPQYMDVVSTSIDILTDFLRQTRNAIDPPDVALEADLQQVMTLELYRVEEGIAEGRRLVDANRAAIEAAAGRGA